MKRWERKERGKRDVPGSVLRFDAAYERECWELPAPMPRVHAGRLRLLAQHAASFLLKKCMLASWF